MFWKQRTYLDVAAGMSGPTPRQSWLRPREGGNPSSPHEEGRCAKKVLEDARTAIARLVEVQSDDVIFTSGATEANALAILGSARRGDHVLYLPSAHASVVENMKLLGERGVEVEALPIKDGRVDTDMLVKMVRDKTVLVSMDAVCGETGVVWNTREVADVLRKARSVGAVFPLARGTAATREKDGPNASRIIFHVDASQAPLTEKISRAHFGADLLTFDASKVGAVRGIGVLVAHRTIPLVPLYRGGGQERGVRAGSESPELARAFAEAFGAAVRGREAFRAVAERERTALVKRITGSIPNVYINESRVQVPNIVNLSFPGRDTDYLVALLDEAGFAVSTRSACETDSETGSRAVVALTGDAERARATLRVSWGADTSSRDLRRFSRALAEAVAFIDSNSRG